MHCQSALLLPQQRNLSVKNVINHCWLKKCLLMPDGDYKIPNRKYVFIAKAYQIKVYFLTSQNMETTYLPLKHMRIVCYIMIV